MKKAPPETMNLLESHLSLEERRTAPFHAHKKAWVELERALKRDKAQIAEGGGARALARQHDKNRLSARERVAALLDAGSPFDELMTFAGYGLYEEAGGAPSGGVVTGVGKVAGRDWLIVANDATVKAGAFFPITAKKVIRAQTVALENRLPTIYLSRLGGRLSAHAG